MCDLGRRQPRPNATQVASNLGPARPRLQANQVTCDPSCDLFLGFFFFSLAIVVVVFFVRIAVVAVVLFVVKVRRCKV